MISYLWTSRFLALVLLLYPIAWGQIPIAHDRWQFDDSTFAFRRASEPSNYYDGTEWTEIQTEWLSHPNGFKAIRSRHHLHIDTTSNIVRFSIADSDSNAHILRTRIGPLFFYHKPTRDTVRIASPNFDNYSMSGDTVYIDDVYPGIDCFIWSTPGGYEHRFVFSAWADSVIDDLWQSNGSNPNIFVVNTFRMFVDSLNVTMYDDNGDVSEEQDIAGQLNFRALGQRLFGTRYSFVWQEDRRAELYKRLHRFGGQLWYLEGYRVADVFDWPEGGYQHNDIKNWTTTALQGGIDYNPARFIDINDGNLTTWFNQNAWIIWFDLMNASTGLPTDAIISSATCSLYANFGGNSEESWLYRGITDEIWITDQQPCFYAAQYEAGVDSTFWASGDSSDVSASFTTTNGSYRSGNPVGWNDFDVTNLTQDIVDDGTDYGIWGFADDANDRVHFSSAYSGDSNFPIYYVVFTVPTAGTPWLDKVQSIDGSGKVHDISDTTKVHHP